MHLQTQSLTANFSLLQLTLTKPTAKLQFTLPKRQFSVKCSVSTVSDPAHVGFSSNDKPSPAEVSRTIMELSSVGTLSTLTNDTWPLGVGVRFAVDDDGTPVLCLSDSRNHISVDKRSSLHVQLEQCGMRTPQCTIQGSLHKPEDKKVLKWRQSMWKKRFGEDVDDERIYSINVERVLQMEDIMEDGVWVTSSDYRNASPDPLREFAEAVVNEINAKNIEDVHRFCNIFVDLDFQVTTSKIFSFFDFSVLQAHRIKKCSSLLFLFFFFYLPINRCKEHVVIKGASYLRLKVLAPNVCQAIASG
ncbi:glutamyl-tRNA reductase-binding protein, chloroplastic isoform X2 [Jatropha curcas]|uniref:glutamyl-tRNA reductase-binding protein, chloroplastic isoform X2 n=1 Tax=Jatropha curcas TaxID=180498 RepID=UPI0005FB7AB3|nr:glutamyl-tRNA reductase-binding protein, chloroplastic isoform X2 [Jatropha curcas]